MKRFIQLLVAAIIILFSLINVGVFASEQFSEQLQKKLSSAIILYVGSPKAFVNNQEKQIDTENDEVIPVIKGGRTLVPLRFISESLGAHVDWYEATKGIVIKYNGKYNLEYVQMKIGDKSMWISNITSDAPDENEIILDVEPQIINGRTFIPLRALVEALGKKVFWDDRGLIVISDKEYIFDVSTESKLIDESISLFKMSYKQYADYLYSLNQNMNVANGKLKIEMVGINIYEENKNLIVTYNVSYLTFGYFLEACQGWSDEVEKCVADIGRNVKEYYHMPVTVYLLYTDSYSEYPAVFASNKIYSEPLKFNESSKLWDICYPYIRITVDDNLEKPYYAEWAY